MDIKSLIHNPSEIPISPVFSITLLASARRHDFVLRLRAELLKTVLQRSAWCVGSTIFFCVVVGVIFFLKQALFFDGSTAQVLGARARQSRRGRVYPNKIVYKNSNSS
ncbi:hypothetical protein ACL9RI_19050 [Janthinobacterium sp. Mn2066]|uniref:hypothetical protein n=1 Tax=Janthinobacterium sp. Mn2066 TaxID=3395264 RepID=UPI003BDDA4EF